MTYLEKIKSDEQTALGAVITGMIVTGAIILVAGYQLETWMASDGFWGGLSAGIKFIGMLLAVVTAPLAAELVLTLTPRNQGIVMASVSGVLAVMLAWVHQNAPTLWADISPVLAMFGALIGCVAVVGVLGRLPKLCPKGGA